MSNHAIHSLVFSVHFHSRVSFAKMQLYAGTNRLWYFGLYFCSLLLALRFRRSTYLFRSLHGQHFCPLCKSLRSSSSEIYRCCCLLLIYFALKIFHVLRNPLVGIPWNLTVYIILGDLLPPSYTIIVIFETHRKTWRRLHPSREPPSIRDPWYVKVAILGLYPFFYTAAVTQKLSTFFANPILYFLGSEQDPVWWSENPNGWHTMTAGDFTTGTTEAHRMATIQDYGMLAKILDKQADLANAKGKRR